MSIKTQDDEFSISCVSNNIVTARFNFLLKH